jgi:hypothetical protein
MDAKETTKFYLMNNAPFMWMLTIAYDRIFDVYKTAQALQKDLEDFSITKKGVPYEPTIPLIYETFPVSISKYYIGTFYRGLAQLGVVDLNYNHRRGSLMAVMKVREFCNTFAEHIPEIRKRIRSPSTVGETIPNRKA